MFHKLHLQMSDYVQHLGCSSENASSGLQFNDSSTDFESSEANLNLSHGGSLSSREAFFI
ncbi:hypothetical protein CIG79_07365 [Escherichia coli]|uniref:hypothetical protein n=1 Tax=Escherichia coli TaxID=562 RepID=UPI001000C17F